MRSRNCCRNRWAIHFRPDRNRKQYQYPFHASTPLATAGSFISIIEQILSSTERTVCYFNFSTFIILKVGPKSQDYPQIPKILKSCQVMEAVPYRKTETSFFSHRPPSGLRGLKIRSDPFPGRSRERKLNQDLSVMSLIPFHFV